MDATRPVFVDATMAARAVGLHPRTMRAWLLAGKVPGRQLGERHSHWRVRVDDLTAFVAMKAANRRSKLGRRMLRSLLKG